MPTGGNANTLVTTYIRVTPKKFESGTSVSLTLGLSAGIEYEGVTLDYSASGTWTSNYTILYDPDQVSFYLPVTVAIPAALQVTPLEGLNSSGPVGGPFSPSSKSYTLTNTGGQSLTWTATKTKDWVSLSPANGNLQPNSSASVTVTINNNANGLGQGAYIDTVSFVNTTNHVGDTTRPVSLTVNPAGALQVTPGDGLTSSGPQGGPFNPSSKTYTLTNPGAQTINWTATKMQGWLTLSKTGGQLNAGANDMVTVGINSVANSLAGSPTPYTDTVTFTNTTNHSGDTTRPVSLTVVTPGLHVVPTDGFTSSGPQGGPFSPLSKTYTLTNTGAQAINWTAGQTPQWVSADPPVGSLAANGGSQAVTVSINNHANTLQPDSYNDTVTFTNATDHVGDTTRSVTLVVSPLPGDLVPTDAWVSTEPNDWSRSCEPRALLPRRDVYIHLEYKWTGALPCAPHFNNLRIVRVLADTEVFNYIGEPADLNSSTLRLCCPSPWNTRVGLFKLIATVDVDNDIAEDDTNNQFVRRFPVPGWNVIDLGIGSAHAINNGGHVTGYLVAGAHHVGVVWHTDTSLARVATTQLPMLMGGSDLEGMALNEAGEVAGYANNASGQQRAILWLPTAAHGLSAGTHALGTLGGPESYGFALDNYANVVGRADVDATHKHAFLWMPSRADRYQPGMNDLGVLAGLTSEARGINGSGQVVGWSTASSGRHHAVLWEPTGEKIDLGTLPTMVRSIYPSSEAYGLNELGEIVGRATVHPGTIWHAMVWLPAPAYGLPTGMSDLGTLGGTAGKANAINNWGLIVGGAETGTGTQHAFVHHGCTMTDLNDVLAEDSGWLLTEATDINDWGQIVGHGQYNGGDHAFLLTPFVDCNDNSISDDDDIENVTSQDCNHNAVPDECDVAAGVSRDCNQNGVPDECDVTAGTSFDCNLNGILDECEPQMDCQPNGVPDECDIAVSASRDCNLNGVPDECDIATGFSSDTNGNGIPDECDADMNCDKGVNGLDLQAFIEALMTPEEYLNRHPGCNILQGDLDGDGNVESEDIPLFVKRLVEGP